MRGSDWKSCSIYSVYGKYYPHILSIYSVYGKCSYTQCILRECLYPQQGGSELLCGELVLLLPDDVQTVSQYLNTKNRKMFTFVNIKTMLTM